MFLKNRKLLPFLCCILTSFFLSAGIIITSDSTHADSGTLETSFSYESYEETYAETEAASEAESEVSGFDTSERKISPFWGFLLLAVGGILSVLILLLMRQEEPYLGPEIELFMLCLSITLILNLSLPMGYLWGLCFLLLISARGLWSWLLKRLPLPWSTAHRLGVRLADSTGRQSFYLLCQFIGGVLLPAGSLMLIFFVQQNSYKMLLGVSGLAAALLPIRCCTKFMRGIDHLSEQIRHLHDGEPVSIQTGIFADEEQRLIDLNRQRDEAIKSAVTSERFKVDLISNVSHDLRTPLTAILGYGELLKEESLSLKGKKQLTELNRKAGYMRDLVESLFELTKVSSGVVESKKEQIDLIRLLEQTIGLFDDQLNKNNLQIRRHYETDHLMLITDGARMHQVFANLTGNAIKYTLPGTRIHLEVKDNDIECIVRMVNIASYEMDFDSEEILQRFARGDKARTTKGSGLGLAIAQTYTESVGGTFQVIVDGEQFSAIVTLPKPRSQNLKDF